MALSGIVETARSARFRQYLTDLLAEVCAIPTCPQAEVAAAARAESAVFDILERAVRSCGLSGARLERRPIDPAIERHPFFSRLYYTITPARPGGLGLADCYAGRGNLVLTVDGESRGGSGVGQALNAHVDVVAPFLPPRVEGDLLYARGACDDKGNAVAIVGALKLLGEALGAGGRLNRDLTAMFVIEEETGGNGSLSLALDRELKRRYESLIVLEAAGGRIYPGNRGAVWYKIDGRLPGANLFEASAFVVEELEAEGRAIRAESDHPLFPHRPVQTCHGIIGRSGQHPSRINGDVSFEVVVASPGSAHAAARAVKDLVEDGLAQYVGLYGDKTQEVDPGTGRPKVDHHYDLAPAAHGFTVRVYGATGHMGAIRENDGAITKMAAMVRALARSRAAVEKAAGGAVSLRLADWDDPSRLEMEGGQGFVPTHGMEEVQSRMRLAAWRGAQRYLNLAGAEGDVRSAIRVTYEKLHNAAFAGEPDSPDMRNALEAARLAGRPQDGPARGWDVSCDARIFACEYPGLPVLTAGVGELRHAHSDAEQVDMKDIAWTAEFLAHFVLKQTGTA